MGRWTFYNPDFAFKSVVDDTRSGWVGHEAFAYDLVSNARPARVVELGTHWGYSFFSMCQAAKDSSLKIELTAIDTWQGDPQAGLYDESVLQTVRAVLGRHYPDVDATLLRSSFEDALTGFRAGSVGLLHIDGLHTYEAVAHDFSTWLPKLRKDGIVLLHDIDEMDQDFGVYRLWDELKERYQTIEFDFGHGLGVVFLSSETPAQLGVDRATLVRHYASGHAARLGKALDQERDTLRALEAERGAHEETRAGLVAEQAARQESVANLELVRGALAQESQALAAEHDHAVEQRLRFEKEIEAREAQRDEMASRIEALEEAVADRDRAVQELATSRAYRLGRALIATGGGLVRVPFALAAAAVSLLVGCLLLLVGLVGRVLAHKKMLAAAEPRVTVAAVVTNFNGKALLEENLPSVVREVEGAGGRVVVVDDGSTDGSVELLIQRFPTVTCVVQPRNMGLPEACRAGIAAIDTDLALLLNNDVSLEPGFVPPLVSLFEDPSVFAASPHLGQVARGGADEAVAEGYMEGGHFSVQFPILHRADLSVPEPAPVLFNCGGAVLYDRRMLLQLGWDPLYEPYYYEDVDLGYRAWRRGASCLHTGKAVARHLHQQSIGRDADQGWLRTVIARNELLFTWKNIIQSGLSLSHALWLTRRSAMAWLRNGEEDRRFRLVLMLSLRRLHRALPGRFAEARAGSVSDTEILDRSGVGLWGSVVRAAGSEGAPGIEEAL